MSEKLDDTIRVRAGGALKRRVGRLAKTMSEKLPVGSRQLTAADITRMALAQYVADNEQAKASK